MKYVYRITYPNGKIYIGSDLTASANYFGSAPSELIASDFTPEQLRDLTIRREVLWWSESATDIEVRAKELDLIRLHRSNDPEVGYNRWPRVGPRQSGDGPRRATAGTLPADQPAGRAARATPPHVGTSTATEGGGTPGQAT